MLQLRQGLYTGAASISALTTWDQKTGT